MPFFGVWPSMMSMCSRRPNRTFVPPLSPHGQSDRTSRDALVVRSWYSMPFFGVGPPLTLCSRRPNRTFKRLCCRSRHGAGRSYKSRALVVRSWYSMPFFGVGPLPRRCACSRRLHKTLIPLSPSCKVNVQVARCARCALMVLDALLWHQATAAAVLSPSTSDVYTAHPPSCRVISLVEMRCLRSWCLKPFFRRWTVLPLCSRRPHRTFIPLLPSCRAISQVEMRSLCARGS